MLNYHPYSITLGTIFVFWNHNNGEDCWLGNGPEGLSLTPSTKRVRDRRSLLKGVAVNRVLYQSILNAKLTGIKKLGTKRCTSKSENRKLENTVKQADSNTWESFTRSGLKLEWTQAGVSASRVTMLRLLQEKGYQATSETETNIRSILPRLWRKRNWTVAQWSKVLFSDKSTLCISLGNQGLEEDWRGTESKLLEVQCDVSSLWWFGVPWRLLVLVHCVLIKSKVNAAVYQEILEQFMLPYLLTSFMEMLISFSSRTLERWETVDPTIQTSWRLNSASVVPQDYRFHATPHWCWSFCAKWAPTKYWLH